MTIRIKDPFIGRGLDYEMAKVRMQKLGIIEKVEAEMYYDKNAGKLNGGIAQIDLTDAFIEHWRYCMREAAANQVLQLTKQGNVIVNENYFLVLENTIRSYCGDNLTPMDDLYIFTKVVYGFTIRV